MPNRRLPLREAELFKSLGHPVRLQILWILAQEEACVCHLEARLKMRQAYLSQQLAVLREAGLVAERRMGPYVYYRARRPQVGDLIDVARRFAGSDTLGVPEPTPSACSCPRCVVLAQPLAEAARRQRRAASVARKVER
jgi:DNA-binding transcriptional ArsR family regulator